MLSAVLVHPVEKEVFVIDNEPIIGQDGTSKNDCERSAAKRLLNHMQTAYGTEWLVWVMDALYVVGLSSGKLSRTESGSM